MHRAIHVRNTLISSLLLAASCIAVANELETKGVGLTYQSLDGNRLVAGRGPLPRAKAVDVALGRPVAWVVGAAAGNESIWVAVLADGSLHAISLQQGKARMIPGFPPAKLDGPPVLIRQERQVAVPVPSEDGSPLSHAVPLARQGRLAFITRQGRLGLSASRGGQRSQIDLKALPDARVLTDETGRVLLLSDPTERYAHGVLGDATEAASMTLVDPGGQAPVLTHIEFPRPWVFEGLAPIWTDWNRDGRREIVATLSSQREGAQIVLYDEEGSVLAESPPMGVGHRWRHAIAVAPFGPDGEMELAEVLTPHLGGVVQFFRWQGRRLVRVASISGFTSHVLGSRNLDLAAAGDFDGDGRLELLLPTQERIHLAAIRRTSRGAELAWQVKLPDRLSSNLAAVTLEGGQMILAAGLADGTLRIFHSR